MSNSTAIQRSEVLPLHPYEPEEFANREEAQDLIAERMRVGLSGRKLTQPVIIFWGVNGIGKSWLLGHLAYQYRFPPTRRLRTKKHSCSALVDLNDFVPGIEGWDRLLSEIVKQIIEQLGDRVPSAAKKNLPFHWISQVPSNGKGDPNGLALSFISFVDALTPEYVLLLIFDSMEVLEEQQEEAFHWFEKQIVAPLARHDKVLMIFAGRRELRRWKQFEVRRRIKKMQLQAFKPHEVAEQFKKAQVSDYAVVGNVIYPYSFGHPYTAWHLRNQLDTLRAPEQAFDEQFVASRHDDIAALLIEVERWLLMDVPSDLRPRLHQASVLRRFHINSLRIILVKLGMEDFLQRPDSYFLELIGQMVSTNLVRFSRGHQGYIVDPTVRRILSLGLRLQDPEIYRDRHTKAFNLYEGWMETLPENCGGFLIEAIFHITARAEAVKPVPARLWEEIEKLLGRALDPGKFDLTGANLFVEELRGDDELRVMLSAWLFDGESLYDMLLAQAEDFQERVAKF